MCNASTPDSQWLSDGRGATVTGEAGADSLAARRVTACSTLTAGYLWAVSVAAAALVGAHLAGWRLAPFRVDAAFDIFAVHLAAAVVATAVAVAAHRRRSAPRWTAGAALAVMPVVLVVSADRLALLAYPPARRDPTAVLFEGHPARRWTLRPGAKAPALGIVINDPGYRGLPVPYAKPAGERRVVILGDSVAFGIGAPVERRFDSLAAERLRQSGAEPVTIANLSVPGYAPWQQLHQLQTEGLSYEPDLVIYAFCLNDIVAWFWRDVPLGAPLPFRYELFEHSGVLRLTRGIWHALRQWRANASYVRQHYSLVAAMRDDDTAGIREAWRVILRHVGQMADVAEAHGSRFAIVMFPVLGQLEASADEVITPQRHLVAFAEENDIPYLDLLDVFREYAETSGHRPRDLFIDRWHLSQRGHQVAAEALETFLASQGLGVNR